MCKGEVTELGKEEVGDIFGCSENQYSIKYKVERFTILECKFCGLAWVSPRLSTKSRFTEVYTSEYPVAGKSSSNIGAIKTWRKKITRRIKSLFGPIDGSEKRLRKIEKFAPKKEIIRLLEIGCWTGDVLALALKQHPGWEVHGIEPMEWVVKIAKERGLAVKHGFLEEFNFTPQSFDIVVAWNTLEHVPDPIGFLTRINQILQPEGVLILHLPNYGSVLRRIEGERWSELKPKEHLFHFNKRTLTRILEKCGYHVLYLHTGILPNFSNQMFAVARTKDE